MHSSCLGNFLGVPVRQNLHLLILFYLNVFFLKAPPSKFSHIHIEYLGLVEAIFREIVLEIFQHYERPQAKVSRNAKNLQANTNSP